MSVMHSSWHFCKPMINRWERSRRYQHKIFSCFYRSQNIPSFDRIFEITEDTS